MEKRTNMLGQMSENTGCKKAEILMENNRGNLLAKFDAMP